MSGAPTCDVQRRNRPYASFVEIEGRLWLIASDGLADMRIEIDRISAAAYLSALADYLAKGSDVS